MKRGKPVSRRELLLGGVGVAAAGVSRRVPGTRVADAPLPGSARGAAMSTQQLAGQRVIFSYPGLTPPDSLLQQISAGEAAGVIFFGENISGDSQIASVIAQLNEANAGSPAPARRRSRRSRSGSRVIRRTPPRRREPARGRTSRAPA
jgi:beta-N-acetylhexosaminidase